MNLTEIGFDSRPTWEIRLMLWMPGILSPTWEIHLRLHVLILLPANLIRIPIPILILIRILIVFLKPGIRRISWTWDFLSVTWIRIYSVSAIDDPPEIQDLLRNGIQRIRSEENRVIPEEIHPRIWNRFRNLKIRVSKEHDHIIQYIFFFHWHAFPMS